MSNKEIQEFNEKLRRGFHAKGFLHYTYNNC